MVVILFKSFKAQVTIEVHYIYAVKYISHKNCLKLDQNLIVVVRHY